MGRLTDEELDEALAVAQSLNSLRLTAAVAELKERRAQDLTSEEREALEFLRDETDSEIAWTVDHERRQLQKTAVAALSKLTRGNR